MLLIQLGTPSCLRWRVMNVFSLAFLFSKSSRIARLKFPAVFPFAGSHVRASIHGSRSECFNSIYEMSRTTTTAAAGETSDREIKTNSSSGTLSAPVFDLQQQLACRSHRQTVSQAIISLFFSSSFKCFSYFLIAFSRESAESKL